MDWRHWRYIIRGKLVASNYPPGVTGNEPEIVGYDDGPSCSTCEAETWVQELPRRTAKHGGPSSLTVCENGHVVENYSDDRY